MDNEPRDPLDLEAVDRQIRINEREEQLKEMGLVFSGESEDCPDEAHEAFLESVMAYENAPIGTHFERLEKAGVELPAPETMDDAALHAKLWEVINALAALDVTLWHTDHLSDRELYEHLWSESLREEEPMLPPGSGWQCSLDMLGACSEEDILTMLRYYDSEEDRERWAKDFPGDVIPPHEEPPYDRDRLLPRARSDELNEWKPGDNNSDGEFDEDRYPDGPPF